MWIQPPVDLVNWPGQVSRNYHLQHVCLQSLTLSCLPLVYVVTIWTILHYHNWLVAYYFIIKFNPVGYISTRYDQRRRKSCADFRSRVASPASMTYIAFHSNLVPRASLQWGKLHKLVQPSSTSFPGSRAKKKRESLGTKLEQAHQAMVQWKVKCSKSIVNPNKRHGRAYRTVFDICRLIPITSIRWRPKQWVQLNFIE